MHKIIYCLLQLLLLNVNVRVKVTVILRPTVSRPFRPGVRHPWPISPILSLIIFLDSFGFVDVGRPLRREVGSGFQFLPGITSAAFLRSESHRTHEHILLPLFLRLPQPGGPRSCIYFPQEQGGPVIPLNTIDIQDDSMVGGRELIIIKKKLKLNSMVWVRERTIPTERPPLVGEAILPTCADRGCHVVSVTVPSGRILGFLDRSRYFSIK
jgi:hypothetical protein